MGSDIFNISVSALKSAQLGLTTAQHNIANANTPGYNRQEILMRSNQAFQTGSGFVGQGANVATIRRIYDQFLTSQINQQQTTAAQLNTYYSRISQMNNMLADADAGLSSVIQSFFSAVNDVSSTPDSMPARQTMIASAQSLISRFQLVGQQLNSINESVNQSIQTSVSNINSYANQIAALNQSIAQAEASSGGHQPNDLLDQRDALISQLSQEVNINVVKQSDGSLNVFTGNGQLLVVGNQSYSLQAVPSSSDPTQLEVAAGSANGNPIALDQSSINGGNLGGLLAFRNETLQSVQNNLGLVATVFAGTMNQQQMLGQDLNGALGTALFNVPSPAIYQDDNNVGNAQLSATLKDYGALTGSDYSVQFDGSNYIVTRLSDKTATTFAPPNAPATVLGTVDGIEIQIPSGTPVNGDSFLIRPTLQGLAGLSMATTDPALIAAAVPVRSSAATANTGTGTISAATVNATPGTPDPAHPETDLNLRQAVTITFTGPNTFDVTGTGPGLPATGVAYTPGQDISYNGWTVKISGAPATGDTFNIGANNNGTLDGGNALTMARLQNQKILYGGTSTYIGAYSQLVSQVGNKTNELLVTSTAQSVLVDQTIQSQQSISGVNLDEEAANLLRYQQLYQAAGKAMQIANDIFSTLLSIRVS